MERCRLRLIRSKPCFTNIYAHALSQTHTARELTGPGGKVCFHIELLLTVGGQKHMNEGPTQHADRMMLLAD